MKKTILELSYAEARQYLLQSESYCTIPLPQYFDFSKILQKVESVIGNRDLKSCLKNDKEYPSQYENVNYRFLVNKDGKYAFRPLQLANPFIYYFIVQKITENDNWNELLSHFQNMQMPTIDVTSIPKIQEKKELAQAAADIPAWWESYEQASIEMGLKYRYIFITDITDCYGSIYTHAISWALLGKNVAKQKRQDKNILGNIIDRYMLAMNNDQTNGIPQGSVLFDLIAEIVLTYADKMLYDVLQEEQISDEDYRIIRYRDDYRIFSNSKELLEIIAKQLQKVLVDLNFRLNSAKTILSEDVILNSIKKDKLDYIVHGPISKNNKSFFSTVQKELFYILYFSREHANSGTSIRLLSSLHKRLEDDEEALKNENLYVLISLVAEIMMTSPRLFGSGTALISMFLEKIPDGKETIMLDVYHKLSRLPNTGELQVWLQRLTYNLSDVDINYDERLTGVVSQDQSVELWNNKWLKSEFAEAISPLDICDIEKRDQMTPVIQFKEINIFEY